MFSICSRVPALQTTRKNINRAFYAAPHPLKCPAPGLTGMLILISDDFPYYRDISLIQPLKPHRQILKINL